LTQWGSEGSAPGELSLPRELVVDATGNIYVVDAGKDNNMPLVNGAEIGKQHPLADGDVIEVAGVKMGFNLT